MKRYCIIFLIVFLITGCKERIDIPLRETDEALLVVEGVLNSGGTTTITLSRSAHIGQAFQFRMENNAQVRVEDKNNVLQQLAGNGLGKYIGNLNLTLGAEYRLRIITTDGREYQSDYVQVRETPAIDSVNWKKENNGLMIYVNTHDQDNDTRYYRWEWEETWQYNSSFFAELIWQEPNIVPIPPGLNTYSCWSNANSNNIILATSSQLQSDVIFEYPVTHIPQGSEKLEYRYSILVRQYALDRTSYEYFNLMKKNTESLGSIFDPQPSELRGNIYCISNPKESVIGYLTASTTTEKRIFITSSEAGWAYHLNCYDFDILPHPDTIKKYVPNFLPWTAEYGPNGVVKYYLAPANCVDCRTRGGSNIKPSFW